MFSMRVPSPSWPPNACHKSKHISIDCSSLVFSSEIAACRVTPLCFMVIILAHRGLSWSDEPCASKMLEGSATRGMLEETWLGKNVLRPQAPEFQKMVRQLDADPNWKIEPGPEPVMVVRSVCCSSSMGTAEAVIARARLMVERENFILRLWMRTPFVVADCFKELFLGRCYDQYIMTFMRSTQPLYTSLLFLIRHHPTVYRCS